MKPEIKETIKEGASNLTPYGIVLILVLQGNGLIKTEKIDTDNNQMSQEIRITMTQLTSNMKHIKEDLSDLAKTSNRSNERLDKLEREVLQLKIWYNSNNKLFDNEYKLKAAGFE